MVVSFHELAERELNDAAEYYSQQVNGLGAGLCRRFPYALLYTIRPDVIRVLAVMNLKRRAGYWVGRS